jgi:NhaP-type Na+/H+ and K+/H+ antiporter
MVKFYSIALALGVIGLIVVILGGAMAENVNREESDPGPRIGSGGRAAIGALVGFGMAGLSAEFSTLDLSWQVALVIAVVGAAAGALWAWYASRHESGSDAGPV